MILKRSATGGVGGAGEARVVDADAVLDLLDRADAWRRPQRFSELVAAAVAAARAKLFPTALSPDFPLTVNAVSGYSGGGKGMIAEFEITPAG